MPERRRGRLADRVRGRPRKYDRPTALGGAVAAFHAKGYAATSLDDLAEATGMNRPSLYNAFGNKEALYREALAHFAAQLDGALSRLLFDEPDIERALTAFYRAALEAYFADTPPRGCFVFCTAPAEAVTHPEIAAELRTTLEHVDALLERRLVQAQREGQIPADSDCRHAAKLAQAVLHSIALRARAGQSRRSLERMARSAVSLLTARS